MDRAVAALRADALDDVAFASLEIANGQRILGRPSHHASAQFTAEACVKGVSPGTTSRLF